MKKLLRMTALALVGLIVPNTFFAQITSFPYSQNFEAFATCGTSCATVCALQDNWVNATTANRDWLVDENDTPSTLTGPPIDHNPGTATGNYLYAEASSPCFTGSNSWHLESPTIDLTGSNDVQFTFWYHMYGQSMGMCHVDVTQDGGVTWALDVIPAWTDNQDLWQQKVVALGAFSGVVKVRIRYENPTDFYGDMALDDIYIYDLLQNDAGISSFANPVLPTCVFNDTVSVNLTNYGTDTLFNVTINWQWDVAAQTPLAWTGALPPGQTATVFLGTVPYTIGSNLLSWTNSPNGVVEFPSGSGNDASSILGLATGLIGSYEIGATGDYTSFNAALTDLATYGVCGPVVFDVQDGIYNEQLVLNTYIGMNTTNTVTFRSLSGDQSMVTLSFAATVTTANYVVRFDDADYFRFEQLTLENSGASFGTVLNYINGSEWNTIWDCRLHTVASASTSTNFSVIFSPTVASQNFNSFIENTIEGGSYGAYWNGTSATSLGQGTVFDGNDFVDNHFYASRCAFQDAVVFTNNRAYGESTYTGTRYGFYFATCDNGFQINGNQLYQGVLNGWVYGLYFTTCDGSPSARGLVSNNMIQVGVDGSTSIMYGIYMATSGFMDIFSNNVLVSTGGATSRAFFATGGGATAVSNNNFVNYTAGYGVYLASGYSVTEMDYNNIHSPGGNVGYFTVDQLTLVDWQAATSFDANGIDLDPLYHSATDLHVCNAQLDGVGNPSVLVATDFDGQPRATTPDLGADEFSGLGGSFLGADITLCAGDSTALSAGSFGDTILWSTGDTVSTIWVSAPGSYDVSLNGVCGTGMDTLMIVASADVYTGFLASDVAWFCTGGSAMLTSSMMADSYSWTGGSTNDTLVVTSGGTYSLDIADACGSGTESVTVEEYSLPVAGFTSSTSFLTGVFTNTSTPSGNTTYSWDFGDATTSTSTNPVHAFDNPTTYTVTLTATNECGSDVFTGTVTLSTVGMDELLLNGDVSVFPNPSKGEFIVDLTLVSSTDLTLRVENMLGALLYESKPGTIEGAYSETISLGNAPAGMYFVRVIAGEQELVKKIIIE
jgi:PKD repeat protein